VCVCVIHRNAVYEKQTHYRPPSAVSIAIHIQKSNLAGTTDTD